MKPENGHWYTKDGQPAHWQKKVDGSGNTPTTIRHARTLGLLPSVTTVLNIMAKPALVNWMVTQGVLAVVTAPDVAGEGLDAKIDRILNQEQQQDQEAQIARDRGSEIHAALESAFQGKWGEVSAEIMPWILPVFESLSQHGKIVATELILVGHGYAGRTDLILADKKVPDVEIIIDFKSAKTLPKHSSWDEHRLQLAAYGRARAVQRFPVLAAIPDAPVSPTLTMNCYISTVEKGKFACFENPPWQKDYPAFEALLKLWQWKNNYVPPA